MPSYTIYFFLSIDISKIYIFTYFLEYIFFSLEAFQKPIYKLIFYVEGSNLGQKSSLRPDLTQNIKNGLKRERSKERRR